MSRIRYFWYQKTINSWYEKLFCDIRKSVGFEIHKLKLYGSIQVQTPTKLTLTHDLGEGNEIYRRGGCWLFGGHWV